MSLDKAAVEKPVLIGKAASTVAEILLPINVAPSYRPPRDSEALDHHDNDVAFIRRKDERHASD